VQVQINTDRNIEGHATRAAEVSHVVEGALDRFSDQITQVEVHLSDENSDKKGGNDDIRCMIEAHLEGHRPLAVTDQAATVGEAVDGAVDKLSRLIESTLGRQQQQQRSRTDPPLPGTTPPE
jgi:ribosome-associated translation inhibitor RaiA